MKNIRRLRVLETFGSPLTELTAFSFVRTSLSGCGIFLAPKAVKIPAAPTRRSFARGTRMALRMTTRTTGIRYEHRRPETRQCGHRQFRTDESGGANPSRRSRAE